MQSVARYLANNFIEKGYRVYWFDTKTTEGAGNGSIVSIVRRFPADAKAFVRQKATTVPPSAIRVPAFTVYRTRPFTTEENRLGIGESEFFWNSEISIDGFADSEFEWYIIQGWFGEWFGNPDTRIPVFNYQEDLTNLEPEQLNNDLKIMRLDLIDRELDDSPATKYYINATITTEFISH